MGSLTAATAWPRSSCTCERTSAERASERGAAGCSRACLPGRLPPDPHSLLAAAGALSRACADSRPDFALPPCCPPAHPLGSNDVEEGGETVFPNLPAAPHQTRENGFSECALEGLAAKPRKGDAGAGGRLYVRWAVAPGSGRPAAPLALPILLLSSRSRSPRSLSLPLQSCSTP